MSEITGKHYSEDYVLQAANIGMSSKNHDGSASLRISSEGSSDNGTVQIDANGGAQMLSGNAAVAVNSKNDGSAMMDGGELGVASVFAGTPVLPQMITLDGGKQSIVIRNGPLPICPTIELTPTSMKLSVGPLSSIELTPEGVSIKGLMVQVDATLEAIIGGVLVNMQAKGAAGVKGPIVQIGP